MLPIKRKVKSGKWKMENVQILCMEFAVITKGDEEIGRVEDVDNEDKEEEPGEFLGRRKRVHKIPTSCYWTDWWFLVRDLVMFIVATTKLANFVLPPMLMRGVGLISSKIA